MSDPLDYAVLEEGRHCNYYTYGRALQFELRQRCESEELDWGESRLREFGETLVARRFVASYMRERTGRGIINGSRLSSEAFDAIVRYARLDPEQLGE